VYIENELLINEVLLRNNPTLKRESNA